MEFQARYQSLVLDQAKKAILLFRKHLYRHNLRRIKVFHVTIDEYSFSVALEADYWENNLVKADDEIY
jgi:hypothetical protein